MWLWNNPTDFDCLTHEFAHAIQYCWDDQFLEYSNYIERFADYCRFVYAYDDGTYNDIILKYCDVCKNGFYAPEDWDAAWEEIFRGSELEGMSIDAVWALYEASDIATMDQASLRQMI